MCSYPMLLKGIHCWQGFNLMSAWRLTVFSWDVVRVSSLLRLRAFHDLRGLRGKKREEKKVWGRPTYPDEAEFPGCVGVLQAPWKRMLEKLRVGTCFSWQCSGQDGYKNLTIRTKPHQLLKESLCLECRCFAFSWRMAKPRKMIRLRRNPHFWWGAGSGSGEFFHAFSWLWEEVDSNPENVRIIFPL